MRQARLWLYLAIAAVGVLFGLGIFTLVYAEGPSYLSSDAETCVNCHVMRDQYDRWNHSSHKAVAKCNDCHTPHTFLGKWGVKALNGMRHSYAFTTGDFEEPIRITEFNADIVQENCVRCHTTVTSMMVASPDGEEARCVSCHGNVGHGNR
jgi:cytochrome c nitrite reductase small subunit